MMPRRYNQGCQQDLVYPENHGNLEKRQKSGKILEKKTWKNIEKWQLQTKVKKMNYKVFFIQKNACGGFEKKNV